MTAADLSSPRKRGRAAADAGAAVASGGGGGAGGGSAGESGGHTHDVRRCVFDAIVLPPPAAAHTPVATPRRLTALQFQFARAEATVNAVYDEDFESWTAASMCLRECASSGAPPYVCGCARGSRLADRKHAEPDQIARIRRLLQRLVAALPAAVDSLDSFEAAFPCVDAPAPDGAVQLTARSTPERCCAAPGCNVAREHCTWVKTRRALLRAAQALQFADDEHNPFVRYTSADASAAGGETYDEGMADVVAAKAERRCRTVLAARDAAVAAVDEVADEDEDMESVSEDDDEL